MAYYQSPAMPKWRVNQLTRRHIKNGSQNGSLIVAFAYGGHCVMEDGRDPRKLAGPFPTIDEAKAEMRRLAEPQREA